MLSCPGLEVGFGRSFTVACVGAGFGAANHGTSPLGRGDTLWGTPRRTEDRAGQASVARRSRFRARREGSTRSPAITTRARLNASATRTRSGRRVMLAPHGRERMDRPRVLMNLVRLLPETQGAGGAGRFVTALLTHLPRHVDLRVAIAAHSEHLSAGFPAIDWIMVPEDTNAYLTDHLRWCQCYIDPLNGLRPTSIDPAVAVISILLDLQHMRMPWLFSASELSSRLAEYTYAVVGASVSSRDAMKRALVKTTCYCEYRDQTESSILEAQRVDPHLDLSGRLEGGYPAFLSSFAQSDKAINDRVPHPFDTHPTLQNRLAELGFEAHDALRDAGLQQPVADSWYGAIRTAPALEQRLWTERQTLIQTVHDVQLAWRLLPANEEETAQVLKHFPHVDAFDKKGRAATLDFDQMRLPEWENPILFKDIRDLKLEDSWGKKRLTITHLPAGKSKSVRTKCYPGLFKAEKGDLLALFGEYYGRHKTAEAANRDEGSVKSQEDGDLRAP